MAIAEEVYNSLLGITAEPYRLPWVNSIFKPDEECFQAYQSMLDAYQRLLIRLQQENDDSDLETMVEAMLTYSKEAGLKMFEYGMLYQKYWNVL